MIDGRGEGYVQTVAVLAGAVVVPAVGADVFRLEGGLDTSSARGDLLHRSS